MSLRSEDLLSMGYQILHDLLIKASPQRVFTAVSDPVELEKWWPLECSGTPEPDAEYRFYFGDPYDWRARVCHINQGAGIHYRMTESDDDWRPTRFGFDLDERAEGTWLRFSHVDWTEANEHFRHSSFCWAVLLRGLKDLLEKGDVVPFEQRS